MARLLADVSKYYPLIVRNIREFKRIAETENLEIEQLWGSIQDIFSDQFILSATVQGVRRFEKILDIVPKGTEDLDTRRFRILARINEQLPYTYERLREQLSILCGEKGYTIELKNNEYTLIVRIEISAKKKFDEVWAMLKRVVPANLVLDVSLIYNQNSTVGRLTHGQLRVYTHDGVRNEEIWVEAT